jgi:ketosteroid isomerase-like protein
MEAKRNVYIEEIKRTEANFAKMVKQQGVATAFLHYAADDAVLYRNNKLISGKPAIEDYFMKNDMLYSNVDLDWLPDKIDVSKSGDLAYTYGKYQMINLISGEKSEGIFHTVWKRQRDGQWRFVWD